MKMTTLMMVVYGVSAVAAILAPHGLLESKVVLIALLLTCSAHICWRTMLRKRAHETVQPAKTN